MVMNMKKSFAVFLVLSNPVLGWMQSLGSNLRDQIKASSTVTSMEEDSIPGFNHTATSQGREVDILKQLNLSSKTPGVAQVPGPIRNVPAFKFRPTFDVVQLPNPSSVISALSSPDGFTLIFVYRQHRKSLGTLLSVHAPGRVTPWFQLTSNLRSGQLLMHYRLNSDSKLHQNAWPLRPATQYVNPQPNTLRAPPERKTGGVGWTYAHLSLNTSSNALRLQLECQPARFQPLAGTGPRAAHGARASRVPPAAPPAPRMHVPSDALVYFRQEPGFKKKFLGSMQVAKVYPYATSQHNDWTCDGYQLVRHKP